MDLKKGVNIDFGRIKKKVSDLINKAIEFLQNLPETIKNAPRDEQAAYGAIGVGMLFFLIGFVLVILV